MANQQEREAVRGHQEGAPLLSEAQVEEFLLHGVLVVDNVLSGEELRAAREGLSRTMTRHGIDVGRLDETGRALANLSSTNGSGGVLDVFYDPWKVAVATNPKLYRMTTQLWEAAYCHRGESQEELDGSGEAFKWQPYGAFEPRKGYAYIDRIGFRVPTKLGEKLGADSISTEGELAAKQNVNAGTKNSSKSKMKKTKAVPIQRSLTPHLDCAPEDLFSSTKKKWRPIQCFVSLTDNLEPNTGGFEAAKGFHRNFHSWAKDRPPTVVTRKVGKDKYETLSYPAPCIGEYTHIRPKEDCEVMAQVQHVPVPAGAAVFFDNRIPHANAYRHNGTEPRSVVYCSFLPDIPLNREYASRQLDNWKRGRQPTDQWIEPENNQVQEETIDEAGEDGAQSFQRYSSSLTQLQRRLLGIEPWDQ